MNLTVNIMTTLLARLVTMVLALVSAMLLARILGPEGRGLFALILLIPDFATTLGLLGFDQSNAVYAGLEPEKRHALAWQSVVIAGVVGGAIALGAILFIVVGAPSLHSIIRGPLWLYILPLSIIPGKLLIDYLWAILRGMNHILLLNVVEVGTKVVSLLLVLLFVWGLRYNVAGAVWADFLVCIGSVVFMIVLLNRLDAWGRPSFDWALCKRSIKFALPAHGGNVLALLNYKVDQVIIAFLLPPEQLGFYVIAVGLVERLWILPGSVGNALLPHLTNTKERDPALPSVVARHVTIWLGLGCLILFIFADVIVRVLFTSSFSASIAPLRWLLPGIFSLGVGKVLVAELSAREKINWVIGAGIAAVLVNIAGNFLLIPRLGILGASLASSVSYTLLSGIIIYYYLQETGVKWTTLVPCRADLLAYPAIWNRRSAEPQSSKEPA